MQRLGGLLLILAGVSLGAYTFLPAPFESERTLRDVTRIAAAPERLSQAGRSSWIVSDEPEQAVESRAKGPIPAVAAGIAPSDRPAVTWSAIVTADQSQQARITSSKPADSETRIQLTRDLQSELKRVGCYAGEINGSWTSSTKKAMSSFMDRVNATLPVNEPDYILLTLVQGHAAKACGSTCPAGQTALDDGRCVPQAVIAARAAKKAKQDVAARELPPARTDLAEASAAREKSPARSGSAGGGARSENRVAAVAAEERLPWLGNDADLVEPSRAPLPRPVQRPEGMMAVGASQLARADIEAPPLPPVTESIAPRKSVRVFPDYQTERAAPKIDSSSGAAYQPGLPGTKSGATVYRSKQAGKPAGLKRSKSVQVARRPPPVAHQPKPKFYYYGSSGRRSLARPGSPAFNMLQAMGGVY